MHFNSCFLLTTFCINLQLKISCTVISTNSLNVHEILKFVNFANYQCMRKFNDISDIPRVYRYLFKSIFKQFEKMMITQGVFLECDLYRWQFITKTGWHFSGSEPHKEHTHTHTELGKYVINYSLPPLRGGASPPPRSPPPPGGELRCPPSGGELRPMPAERSDIHRHTDHSCIRQVTLMSTKFTFIRQVTLMSSVPDTHTDRTG